VSRVRVLHPEFGYVGSPSFCRTFVALVICGLIVGAISAGIFKLEPDRDPMDAMALAPAETLNDLKPTQPGTQSQRKPANAPSVQKIDSEGTKASLKAASIKPTCREHLGEVPEGNCAPVRVVRVRPVRAVNEQPLIAAVPIGQRDDPRVLAAPPPTPASLSPSIPPEEPKATPALTETSVAEATPADAAPAAEPTPPASNPTVTSKKPRPRVHHAHDEPRSRRREQYSYASSYSTRSSSYNISNTYLQSGYARVW
jgi:hypothetical protein